MEIMQGLLKNLYLLEPKRFIIAFIETGVQKGGKVLRKACTQESWNLALLVFQSPGKGLLFAYMDGILIR